MVEVGSSAGRGCRVLGVGGLENGGGRMCGCIGKVRPVKSCKRGQTCFAVLAAGVPR